MSSFLKICVFERNVEMLRGRAAERSQEEWKYIPKKSLRTEGLELVVD